MTSIIDAPRNGYFVCADPDASRGDARQLNRGDLRFVSAGWLTLKNVKATDFGVSVEKGLKLTVAQKRAAKALEKAQRLL